MQTQDGAQMWIVEPWDLTDDESDNSGNEQDADELVLTEAQILRLTS